MPSDEKIERVARAIYEARGAHEPPRAWRKWDDIGDEARAVWCRCAVAALAVMEREGEAASHPLSTSAVVSHEAANVSDKAATRKEALQVEAIRQAILDNCWGDSNGNVNGSHDAAKAIASLYASPRPEAVGEAVKAERERCAWIADNFDYNSVECDHYNLMPLGYKICEGIAAAIMAGEEDKG